MLREHYRFFKRMHLGTDLLAICACFGVCRLLFDPAARHLSLADLLFSPTLLIPLAILGIILGSSQRAYEYRFRKLSSAVGSTVRVWMISIALTLAVLFGYPPWVPDRTMFVAFAALSTLVLVIIHVTVWLGLHLYRRSGRSQKNVLIVGTGRLAQSTADEILSRPGQGLKIFGFLDWNADRRFWRYRDIPTVGTLADLPTIGKSRQVDMVIFAVGYKTLGKIAGVVRICNRMGLPAIVLTDVLGDTAISRTVGEFFGRPGVSFAPAPHTNWATAVKNLSDRMLAATAMLLLLPFLGLAALAITLTSPGPVFFKQTRVGLNGRRFKLWKFRTMVADAEKKKANLADLNEMSGPVFKISNDPRITQVGKFLRRTSIDELPQLINVIKGDMSLVGPRPPLPDEVTQYDGWERRRLSVKPGLTCLWQIGGRNRIDFEEWMKLDLEYIDNWSLKKDAEILVKTIPAVLRGSGAH